MRTKVERRAAGRRGRVGGRGAGERVVAVEPQLIIALLQAGLPDVELGQPVR